MSSTYYQELLERVHVLKGNFLPPLSPVASYTEIEQDRMRAFRLLVHAEIEAYLEAICIRLVEDLEMELKGGHDSQPIHRWASRACLDARQAAGSNNGIKQEDIIKMFSHLGFRAECFITVSSIFLDKMTELGKKRGAIAHTSVKIAKEVTRQGEEKLIDEVLSHLDGFDKLMARRRLRGFF